MDKKITDLDENAKNDWFKIVKKHKKRQRGLPALSTLNTNAGNVEKSIELFNMMQPSGNASVDASNGNVEAGGMGESLQLKENVMETITLHYENLPIEVVTRRGNPGGYYDYGMSQWYPDDDETKEILIDWDYEADEQTVKEFLQDLPEVQIDLKYDELTDAEFDKLFDSEFDNIVEKYADKLLEYFYDSAKEDAQTNFSYDYEYTFDESMERNNKDKFDYDADDTFDMSTRTLL